MQAESDIQIGAMLRSLRRSADLSQRELADRSGVPQATVARVESGATRSPSFLLVERLVRAAGGRLSVAAWSAESSPLREIPQEQARDRAGRRYPAHLDARAVRTPGDWWGAWWMLTVVPSQWPLETVPATTFDRSRLVRDERRARAERGMTAVVRRLAEASWTWVAEAPDGDWVGVLRAHRFADDLDGAIVRFGVDVAADVVVLDSLAVRRGWRRLGIGGRLVEGLRAASSGPVIAPAADYGGERFLWSCGFRSTREFRPVTWFVRRARSEDS